MAHARAGFRTWIACAALLAISSFARASADELAFAKLSAGDRPFNHAPGIVALDTQTLLACWYSGASERGPDSVVLCARSSDRGRSWSAPVVAVPAGTRARGATDAARSVGNAVPVALGGHNAALVYGVVQSHKVFGVEICHSWRCGRIDIAFSSDGGNSFSHARRLDDRAGALPRSHTLVVPGLGVLIPVYVEGGASSTLLMSADFSAMLAVFPIPGRSGLIQPSLLLRPDGRVYAYLRDERRERVYFSELNRRTRTWSVALPTNLENPGSAVEAFVDQRGRTALVHNIGRSDRSTLAISFSTDGARFSGTCILISHASRGDVAYPGIVDLGGGEWLVVVSTHGKADIEATTISQQWLNSCSHS